MGQSFTTTCLVVKLALTSALVFEISQLQSAQDRVVLARTNAIIVRCEHYELVAMRGGGGQNRSHARTQYVCASFVEIRLYDLWPGGVILWGPNLRSRGNHLG